MTRNWGWLLMIAIAGGATCSLFLTATDARDVKPPPAQSGWLTFNQCLVAALASYEVAATESGIIAELSVAKDDLVKTGQPIGQLDSRIADVEKEIAAKQLQHAKHLAKNESKVELAESVVDETKLKLQKTQELVNKGGAAESEVREKAIAVKQAEVQLIEKRLEIIEREMQIGLADSNYKLAELKVKRLKLTSPATGTVVQIDRPAGDWVAAGTTIAKVIRLDELRVDFFVDMKQVILASLQDQPVTITADFGVSGSKDFAGKITGLASEVGSTGKVRVSATVQNQQINDRWILLPGMPVVLKLVPKS
jgi:multidrug resistance efflux pump